MAKLEQREVNNTEKLCQTIFSSLKNYGGSNMLFFYIFKQRPHKEHTFIFIKLYHQAIHTELK